MAKKRVVITGATGYIAQRMLDALQDRYELVCLDVTDQTRDNKPIANIQVADLTDANRDQYRQHFKGADAVVHCAFTRAQRKQGGNWADNSEEKWQSEYINVGMAYNVYKTCLEEGVKRIVVCSSNHAADYYERLWVADKLETVTPGMRASDNFYGWAKAAYELLGFVFATGKVDGQELEVVQWRIGGPRDDDLEHIAPGDLKNMHRSAGAYFSARDQAHQCIQMIESPNIRDEHGLPFYVGYGISANSHRFWSLANADQIGYQPQDNSQVKFADKIAELAKAPPTKTSKPPWM